MKFVTLWPWATTWNDQESGRKIRANLLVSFISLHIWRSVAIRASVSCTLALVLCIFSLIVSAYLFFQDAGQVIPGGVCVVIKPNGPPRLCQADEVGEICIYAHSTGSAYWGLDGLSANTFRVTIVFSLFHVTLASTLLGKLNENWQNITTYEKRQKYDFYLSFFRTSLRLTK